MHNILVLGTNSFEHLEYEVHLEFIHYGPELIYVPAPAAQTIFDSGTTLSKFNRQVFLSIFQAVSRNHTTICKIIFT
jgi:hypothetical protein